MSDRPCFPDGDPVGGAWRPRHKSRADSLVIVVVCAVGFALMMMMFGGGCESPDELRRRRVHYSTEFSTEPVYYPKLGNGKLVCVPCTPEVEAAIANNAK